ncbi:MAG TPA: M20/M25/M40 family metallo-hydrolase [Gemmatimonadales bacterium]|jgi:carboxypeptidase Q|nr:M20/M25/M40 family metallo-hydrolase [Gemmatimonadales bacterium]
MRQTLWIVAGFSGILAGIPERAPAQGNATERPADFPTAHYRPLADRLIAAATRDSAAYIRLSRLVDTFGPRLSGSASLEGAIDWILSEMKTDGLDNVRGERVMVPHWVRGVESATLIHPRRARLSLLGLGGSVATAASGITAPVLVVTSFDDLRSRAAEAHGKIVLFDVPFTTYRETVRYRVEGASAAAQAGAVASLVRSIAPFSIRSPHTGAMRYDSTTARIPAAALSVEDAQMLHRMQAHGDSLVLNLVLRNRTLPDAPSRNVVAEIRGRERPDEVVVLGGHIDSWDVGQGAVDDGGGSVAAWEAVRLIRRLRLQPRRTIRVVLWTNEENGGRGALAYRDSHSDELARHVAAMESDNGTFSPRGFRYSGPTAGLDRVRQIGALLESINAAEVQQEYESPEADIAPLVERGVPGLGLDVERSRYFWYHHSEGDTLDKVDPAELARCVAALAVMAYVLADLPEGIRTVSR